MKAYETPTRQVLPRRTYTIIRVDGRAFHTYLRQAKRPFDYGVMQAINLVAVALCSQISGTVFSYQQSDEVSLLLTDFATFQTEPWFGGNVQKIASSAAALATATFNDRARTIPGLVQALPPHPAMFDGRVFTIPSAVEVANYFLWRQRDAVRNSIAMAAQACFSHSRLHGLNGDQMQELLWQEAGINWNDYPEGARRGRICRRITSETDLPWAHWLPMPAPRFAAEPGNWLAEAIPVLPCLKAA
jgi:tRNA(His) 5'-end guanylyltransferase